MSLMGYSVIVWNAFSEYDEGDIARNRETSPCFVIETISNKPLFLKFGIEKCNLDFIRPCKLRNCENCSFGITLRRCGSNLFQLRNEIFVTVYMKDRWGHEHFKKITKLEQSVFRTFRYPFIWEVRKCDFLKVFTNEMKCVITFGLNDSQLDFKEKYETSFLNPLCLESLSCDLYNLLISKTETDMLIKCEDTTFQVHRSILSARSKVFAAMFRADMSEKRDGIVEIVDMEPVVLGGFLQYIYSGTLPNMTEDMTQCLYAVAHKYGIETLHRRCTDLLLDSLTENNVYKFLLFADEYNDTYFKSNIISFIIKNEDVLYREEWLKFSDNYPRLSNETYRAYFKKFSLKLTP